MRKFREKRSEIDDSCYWSMIYMSGTFRNLSDHDTNGCGELIFLK